MTDKLKSAFEKTSVYQGTQQEYEKDVDRAARLYPNGFDQGNALAFISAGIQPKHVTQRAQQLKQG